MTPALPSFSQFFQALWGYTPFPWQCLLADRITTGPWPQALDLPTAAGKTACIEIALYALAAQFGRTTAERTAPRRIWFVVDRRIVVDEAHARAEAVAEQLHNASRGPLREIADRLRRVAGTERPLAVARLRGGVFRDDGWARLPSQPAVITSTVDQLGSRLLFRGYGHSALTAPIFAGLAANDSLVLLDEAHCSVPFLQTLRAIETYRGPRWAEVPIATPFAFVVLSATPPADIPAHAVFPGSAREQALDHPELLKRVRASKRAALTEVRVKKDETRDSLVDVAADRAVQYVKKEDKRRIGAMFNRVRTAEAVAAELRERLGDKADIVLLTGRMRPLERDGLVDRWKATLRATSPDDASKPIVVVSTQCLEVGADFSFDALVSEAASLDALRQRFGRLDRMGRAGVSPATIIIRDRDADPQQAGPDRIYGTALAATWELLKDRAQDCVIDFGVEALRSLLQDIDDLSSYLAPVADAPVLLPAHLDLLCQTAPVAHPEPDVSLYLHGKDRVAPEVRVVWRADLVAGDAPPWIEIVALCPPLSGETLSVPLFRLRAFLAGTVAADDAADIEGVSVEAGEERQGRMRPCVVWRGRDRSRVAGKAEDIAPGDTVVLPAAYGMCGLGQSAPGHALGAGALDLWEPALAVAGRPPAIRLNRVVLAPWLEFPPLRELVSLAEEPQLDGDKLREAIDAMLQHPVAEEDALAAPPTWWLGQLAKVRAGRTEEHPGGGIVLFGRDSIESFRQAEPDLFADDDDLTSSSSSEVTLDEHSELVKRTVEKLAERCLPEKFGPVLALAAWWHDAGKLDERFQILLHQGNELAALSADAPLAKSSGVPTSPARRRAIRQASGLPAHFRHEMLSVELAERHAPGFADPRAVDLFLHAIGSHHGYARPFAPVCADAQPPAVASRLGPTAIALDAEERAQRLPAHHAGAGHAERFWRLVRRHGWWGLAYLEAILRLGDWYASGLRLNDNPRGEVDP
jgi:CRISPR-associated endonuclease/helicase Cas3